MKNFLFLITLATAFIFTSCGSDEPQPKSMKAIYEATFLNQYPGSSVEFPVSDQRALYLESFIPNTSDVSEEIISWGTGATTTHDTYHLEVGESTAKLIVTIEGKGINKFNNKYTRKIKFTPGEYKDKENPDRFTMVVKSDIITVYENDVYYYNLPNPMEYISYGETPWEEEYSMEVSTYEQDLTVTKYSDTKISLFNADFFYEFNPTNGLLIQEKPEKITIGELDRIK